MIAFGCAVTRPEEFASCAQAGIENVREDDSVVFAVPSGGTLFETYNSILDKASELPGLEALVLLHQDTEIETNDFCSIIRDALADPDVAIVGCVGAVGVRSIAWWEGAVTAASFSHRYSEFGGGEIDGCSWEPDEAAPFTRHGEVDSVDGFLLVLSPWAVSTLRFDESLGRIHGYDLDICLQAREAGRKVVTADFRAVHRRSIWLISDPDDWAQANVRVVEKWEGRVPGIGEGVGSWRERALRAEAGADAGRLTAYLLDSEREAAVGKLERDIEETVTSDSWRLVESARRLRGALSRRRRNPVRA